MQVAYVQTAGALLPNKLSMIVPGQDFLMHRLLLSSCMQNIQIYCLHPVCLHSSSCFARCIAHYRKYLLCNVSHVQHSAQSGCL